MAGLPKSLKKDIDELKKRARKQGFVVQENILNTFVEPEIYIDELDNLYDYFITKHIDIFESTTKEDEEADASTLTRELEQLSALSSTGVTDPVRMYLKEMDAIRHELKIQKKSKNRKSKPIKRLVLFLWKWSSKYGESPGRFAVWVVIIISIFALLYLPILPDMFDWWPTCLIIKLDGNPYTEGNTSLTAIYFSVVTFTTLGFGDITPLSGAGKIAVVIEVILGYVMFGILLTLVARKMTRH